MLLLRYDAMFRHADDFRLDTLLPLLPWRQITRCYALLLYYYLLMPPLYFSATLIADDDARHSTLPPFHSAALRYEM